MTTINFCGRHGFKKGEVTKLGEKDYIVLKAADTLLTVREPYFGELWFLNLFNKIKKAVKSNKKRLRDLPKLRQISTDLKDMTITFALTLLTVLFLSVTPAAIVYLYFKIWGAQ